MLLRGISQISQILCSGKPTSLINAISKSLRRHLFSVSATLRVGLKKPSKLVFHFHYVLKGCNLSLVNSYFYYIKFKLSNNIFLMFVQKVITSFSSSELFLITNICLQIASTKSSSFIFLSLVIFNLHIFVT